MIKKSLIMATCITLFLFGIILYIGTLYGQYNPGTGTQYPPKHLGQGSRDFGYFFHEIGTTGTYIQYYGTESVSGSGTAGRITGTSSAMPYVEYNYNGGTPTYNIANATLQNNGADVGFAGSMTDYVLINSGTGTDNQFTNPTLLGVGTLTVTLRANGVDISPAEIGYLDNTDSEIEAHFTTVENNIIAHAHTGAGTDSVQIAHNSLTGIGMNSHAAIDTLLLTHAHAGTDSTQISHNNLTGIGTNNHATIDTFIASKAQASGLASLDASSLVVQNPTSASATPGANKIVIADGSGKIADGWLNSTITALGQTIKLGTETTGNTDNIAEGSTNKYYTDARVNTVISNTSSNALNDIDYPTTIVDGQVIVRSGGQWTNGTSSTTVSWGGITGVPTDNSYITATPGTNKIPYNTSNLDGWLSAQVVGTTTSAVSYNVKGDVNGKIDNSWFLSGFPVRVSVATTATIMSLSSIPDDNTIPQNTEGTEVLTVSHTPLHANNILLVEAVANVSSGALGETGALIAAIFRDSTADAIGASRIMTGANTSTNADNIICVVAAPFTAGGTSTTTFKLRAGASVGTMRLNASSQDGVGRFGGKWYTRIKVTEYKP
ncbi:MAG: hypothetical protein E3K37_01240 [Candidatus Kuenenia sp.]|nr:hypothetical protein [Candidatus Kuenenia hertensis]